MTRKKNPSDPPSSGQVPFPDEFYEFATRFSSGKAVANKLICSEKIGVALFKGNKNVRVTPLQLEAMQLQMNRVMRLSSQNSMWRSQKKVPRQQRIFASMLRAAATLAVQKRTLLDEFQRVRYSHPKVPVWASVTWCRPMYDFAVELQEVIIPHLKHVWGQYPEYREELFGGTGFEETYIQEDLRTRRKSPKLIIKGPQ